MSERVSLGDGGDLGLVRAGEPDAPVTVLLLHSYAQDRRVWHKVISLLAEAADVSVVAYDHRGHGESSAASGTLEQLGDDLAEVLERVVPHGPVILVGHGMGGLVAMRMIARHRLLASHRVGGLMFLSSVGWVAETFQPVARLVQDLHVLLGPRLVDGIHRKIDKATTIGLRWLLLGDDPDPDDVRLVAEMVARHWPDTVALFRPALARGDRAAALEVAAGMPVVVMVGERDRLVPGGEVAVPHGHTVTVPGAGHMLPLEAAAEIVPRILAEVREVLTR